jgi:hypothetical protein
MHRARSVYRPKPRLTDYAQSLADYAIGRGFCMEARIGDRLACLILGHPWRTEQSLTECDYAHSFESLIIDYAQSFAIMHRASLS